MPPSGVPVVEAATMVMLQPMWVTIIVQVFTLMLAAGVSYGMTRAKLSSNEKEIVALQAKMMEIEKEMQVWQRQRLTSVMTVEDCEKMQGVCQGNVLKSLSDLSTKLDSYVTTSHLNQQSLALVIGAICTKLDIPLPELK
jgi:hypothetical protein